MSTCSRARSTRSSGVTTRSGPRSCPCGASRGSGSIPTATLPIRRVDLADDQAALDRLLLDEGRAPFDLHTAPLARGLLARITGRDHVVALVLHHLVSDGWSSGVIIEEMAALYAAYSAGRPSPLPDLRLQYADYVEWQQAGARRASVRRRPGVLEAHARRRADAGPAHRSSASPSAELCRHVGTLPPAASSSPIGSTTSPGAKARRSS